MSRSDLAIRYARLVDKLIRGLLQYKKHEQPQRRAMFESLGKGQSPDTIFITCADSRIDPNLLVQGEPGDLFQVRTVGNLIAPTGDGDKAAGDVSEAAALEYGLLALGVKDIIICGHSRCGAMSAVLDKPSLERMPNLREWLNHGVPSLDRVERAELINHSLPLVEQLSQVNVLQQLDHVRSYTLVREREEQGDVYLHGWWFDVSTGDIHIFDMERGGFVLLDEEEGERILHHHIKAPRLSFLP
jgi:carbonic anhydrase